MGGHNNKGGAEEVVLSICIPTYNRIRKTSALVNAILGHIGLDIEVVVVDNCSTDDTEVVLSTIRDSRFKYLRNKEAIGGMPNILKSLTYGSGRYVLLCLDKDWVLPENIPTFIQRLKQLDVGVGQCSLNSEEYLEDISYNAGLESMLHIAYTSEHPSGLFIKNAILKQRPIIESIVDKYKTFAFLPELLKAEVAVSEKAGRINMPFVFTETLEACEKEVSHTYKGDNIYFFPKNIINRLTIYSENLFNLNISKNDKIVVLKRLFVSLLNASTLGFKEVMKNKSICMHHGINTRHVSLFELVKADYLFSKAFFNSEIPVGFFTRFYICVIGNLKIVYIMARNKVKK